ncbi:hypothetical protein BD779DRAFT_1044618 [Infundibulicybe gibba]|nr:hypothetical protein BD779DRAFT_1044618 [Infundibulicybe gibba]
MKHAILAAASTFLLYNVNAQAPAWGQCGGIGWSGPKTCQPGQVCTYLNDCKCFSTLDILMSHIIIPLHRPLPMSSNNYLHNHRRHAPNTTTAWGTRLVGRTPLSRSLLHTIPSPASFQFRAVRVSHREGLYPYYNAPTVSALTNDQLRFICYTPQYQRVKPMASWMRQCPSDSLLICLAIGIGSTLIEHNLKLFEIKSQRVGLPPSP